MGNICVGFLTMSSENNFPPYFVSLMLLIMSGVSPGGPHIILDYKRKTVCPQVGAGQGQHSRQRDLRGSWKEREQPWEKGAIWEEFLGLL